MGLRSTREVKDRFFVDIPATVRATEAAGKDVERKEMHPSSVIHCPGCEPYVFPRRSASRIIQIIASEMIISDDCASMTLPLENDTRGPARGGRYLHLFLVSIKDTYFIIYPKVLRNSRLRAYRAARATRFAINDEFLTLPFTASAPRCFFKSNERKSRYLTYNK